MVAFPTSKVFEIGDAVRVVSGPLNRYASGYVIEVHNGYVHFNIGNNRTSLARVEDVERAPA